MTPALHHDFARFLVSGGAATVIHWGVLWFCVRMMAINEVIATSVGFAIAALVSYLLNYFWTFRSNIPHRLAIPRFLVVAGSGLALNALIFAAAFYALPVHYFVAQAIATGIVLFWNFFLQRSWSFARTSGGIHRSRNCSQS